MAETKALHWWPWTEVEEHARPLRVDTMEGMEDVVRFDGRLYPVEGDREGAWLPADPPPPPEPTLTKDEIADYRERVFRELAFPITRRRDTADDRRRLRLSRWATCIVDNVVDLYEQDPERLAPRLRAAVSRNPRASEPHEDIQAAWEQVMERRQQGKERTDG